MPSRREQLLGDLSDEALADYHATVGPGSQSEQEVQAEYMLRQMQMQREVADAAIETANYTRQSARYMRWSVIVLAVSALLTLVVAITRFHIWE
jgi:hypothetical protein